jgi:hypothetical protein
MPILCSIDVTLTSFEVPSERSRVLGLGQHQVQDVLGQVVIAARDEDLGAANLVLAAAHGLGLGERAADVATSVGLGQAHRAGVGPVVELRAVGADLLLGAEVLDDVSDALGQRRVHVERGVGAAHDLFGHRMQRERTGLAAKLFGDRQPSPADVVKRLPRRLEAVGSFDFAVDQLAAGGITGGVERSELVFGPAVDLFEYLLDLLLAPVFVRGLAEDVLQLELLEQNETGVAKVGFVAVDRLRHRKSPRCVERAVNEPSFSYGRHAALRQVRRSLAAVDRSGGRARQFPP